MVLFLICHPLATARVAASMAQEQVPASLLRLPFLTMPQTGALPALLLVLPPCPRKTLKALSAAVALHLAKHRLPDLPTLKITGTWVASSAQPRPRRASVPGVGLAV